MNILYGKHFLNQKQAVYYKKIYFEDAECHETCFECYGALKNQCRVCKNDL